MVKIRLKRTGQRGRPHYRIVVIDSRRARDGKYIEALGHYNPRDKALVLNQERADYWLSKGAQTTDTAGRLLRRKRQATSDKQASKQGLTEESPKSARLTAENAENAEEPRARGPEPGTRKSDTTAAQGGTDETAR